MRKKLSAYHYSNPSNDEYFVEVLRRARMHADQNARVEVQQRLGGVVRDWLHRHPNREALYQLDNEENYVGAAFARFWQVTIDQQIDFSTLAAALQYLRVSLNGAILETLRTSSRPREVSWCGTGEPHVEDHPGRHEIWDTLQTLLPGQREQRLAYLLYHCGLKPREVVRCRPQEWREIQEIYFLRCIILERLLRLVDQLSEQHY